MKKILALMIAGILFVSLPVNAFATNNTGGSGGNASGSTSSTDAGSTDTGSGSSGSTDTTLTGSPSDEAEALRRQVEELQNRIEEQQKNIDNYNRQIQTQNNQIAALISTVQASLKANKSSGGGAPAGRSPQAPSSVDYRTQALIKNNAVSYGGNIVSQGGHVEINGGKSNVTFLVGVPDGGTMNSAASLAAGVSGSLINCVTVSSSVAFRTAKVNFYITGVNIGDNIAVYQIQGGKWVQLQTAEIRKDHVVVNMSQTGVVAFVRVPVLATATH